MPQLKTAVFTKDGNEFILPGLQYLMDSDNPYPGDPIAITWKAMLISTMLQAKLKWHEYQTSDAEPWTIDIPSAVGHLIGRQFEHGSVRVWFVSGPEFDKIVARI